MTRISDYTTQDRRHFLRLTLGGGALLAVGGIFLPRLLAGSGASAADAATTVSGADMMLECFADDDGHDLGKCHVQKLVLTDAQWRQRLSPAAYDVMRHDGTEMAYSGPHEKPSTKGMYRCTGCDTALFDAGTQFNSGTGWPSFWRPIARRNVLASGDQSFGMRRTAINCAGCDSHLGHVFDDGPQPTGLRYCMNSVALRFVPRAVS